MEVMDCPGGWGVKRGVCYIQIFFPVPPFQSSGQETLSESARCFCIAWGSGVGGTCAVAGDDGHAYFTDSVRRDGWGVNTGSRGEFSGQHLVILSAAVE